MLIFPFLVDRQGNDCGILCREHIIEPRRIGRQFEVSSYQEGLGTGQEGYIEVVDEKLQI